MSIPRDAKLWPEGQICRSVPHTQDKFLFLHTYGYGHLNKIKFTLKYFAFMSTILIFTSFRDNFCDVPLIHQVTWRPLQPMFWRRMLVTFLPVPQVHKSYLIQVNKVDKFC